jgi:hypothetical protein
MVLERELRRRFRTQNWTAVLLEQVLEGVPNAAQIGGGRMKVGLAKPHARDPFHVRQQAMVFDREALM